MSLEIEVPFWVLTVSYWIHLLATVTWLGGLVLMAVVAWPAVRDQFMSEEQWVGLQRRFTPFINGSLVLLWITGFLQMTADPNYEGFLAIAIYIQWRIHPALARLAMLEKKHPAMAAADREKLSIHEIRLVRLNLICASAVLFLTAAATAV